MLEEAPLTGQIRSFLAWVGPGRKLTSTGRIGLADARHLGELLGTGDTIDPDINGRVFKTRSSEDLAHLSRIVAWAKAARLVRVTGTKLAPVKKNAALTERPFDLVLALLEAYPRLGQPLFPRNTWRTSLVGDEFTDISQELITALLRSAGPCPLDELNGIARDAIEVRYVLASPGAGPDTSTTSATGWDHELVIEASAVADADTVYPACTGGEGACPPEDCGGPGGFADLKDLLAGPPGPRTRGDTHLGRRGLRSRALRPDRRQRRGGLSLREPARPGTPARSAPRPPPVRHGFPWLWAAGPHRLPPRSPGIPDHRAVPSGTR